MVEKLIIKAAEKTPHVNFDPESGRFLIHGYSLPENSMRFYEPIIRWLNRYIQSPNKKTEFDFRLIILNTSSSKMFIDMFRIINQLVESKTSDVSVVWYYENDDEDMYDVAMQYKDFCKAKFELIGVEHRLME